MLRMMTSRGSDGDLLHRGLTLAELLHKVGGHAGLLQLLHEEVGHLVVDGALAGDGALLQAVKTRMASSL